ncbi:YceI family protein [Deinococcus sp.]|uniref:YceI family protein n=1 Tax=Deinococcus sp. TaxID=47478 RepID=UPI0025E2BA80|nr:YceI family protein [Deinococcus sp.]
MNTSLQRPLVALLALTLPLGASAARYTSIPNPATGAHFNFRVTFIPVPGQVSAVNAQLDLDPAHPGKASGLVQVPLGALGTGIGLRDQHARNYLKVADFPAATFKLAQLSGIGSLPVGQSVSGQVSGVFSLAGISQPLRAPITALRSASGQIAVMTTFNVTLRDFGIRIPGADARTDVQVNFTLAPQ